MDRLVEVTQNGAAIAEYEYDANSQLISNVRNDLTTTYEYNELGQITQLTTSDINSQVQQFSYQYDKLGNIVEETRTEENQTNNRSYSYDEANQLIVFVDNNYIETYTYDNVGNMLTKNVNDILTEYTYNEANQLINEITNAEQISYNYNSNGDLTSKSTGEQYSYDIQGNLTAITGNGIDKEYTYNGNGNRLSETTDGETVYYVNDVNRAYEQVLQTYDESGNVVNTYTYGLQRIQSVGETTETYLYDGRGSVVRTVNNSNQFVSYSYTAYGDLMPDSLIPNVFGYNADATDYSTGMQHLRARYYDTGVQRFVQEDDYRGSFSEPLTMHRYIYVGNEPVNRIDPSGYGWLSNAWDKVKSVVNSIFTKKESTTAVIKDTPRPTSLPELSPMPTPAPPFEPPTEPEVGPPKRNGELLEEYWDNMLDSKKSEQAEDYYPKGKEYFPPTPDGYYNDEVCYIDWDNNLIVTATGSQGDIKRLLFDEEDFKEILEDTTAKLETYLDNGVPVIGEIELTAIGTRVDVGDDEALAILNQKSVEELVTEINDTNDAVTLASIGFGYFCPPVGTIISLAGSTVFSKDPQEEGKKMYNQTKTYYNNLGGEYDLFAAPIDVDIDYVTENGIGGGSHDYILISEVQRLSDDGIWLPGRDQIVIEEYENPHNGRTVKYVDEENFNLTSDEIKEEIWKEIVNGN